VFYLSVSYAYEGSYPATSFYPFLEMKKATQKRAAL